MAARRRSNHGVRSAAGPTRLARLGLLALIAGGASGASACSSNSSTGFPGSGDDGSTPANTDDASGGSSGGDGAGPVAVFTASEAGPSVTGDGGPLVLPANFVATDLGGYALGPAIEGDGADAGVPANTGSANCSLVTGVVRDFKNHSDDNGTGDPDFGTFSGAAPTTGLVLPALGSDGKPAFAGTCAEGSPFTLSCRQQLTTKANFEEWYRYTPNVNKPYLIYLEFVPNAGVYTFQSSLYFPLDGAGWGNNAADVKGKSHNFGFTTEIHLAFTYKGGETFKFIGDDDVWVFINGKLAVDLGGLHPAATGTVSLDSLGLTKGKVYPLDLFQAERSPPASTFRVDTNLGFTSCGTVVADPPPPQ